MIKNSFKRYFEDIENAEKILKKYGELSSWYNKGEKEKIIEIGNVCNYLISDISLLDEHTIVISYDKDKIYIRADDIKKLKFDKKYKDILMYELE